MLFFLSVESGYVMTDNIENNVFGDRARLKVLRIQHRDLDVAIGELSKNPTADQLRVRRLKKQKLLLRDQITRMESEIIPDLNA